MGWRAKWFPCCISLKQVILYFVKCPGLQSENIRFINLINLNFNKNKYCFYSIMKTCQVLTTSKVYARKLLNHISKCVNWYMEMQVC